MLVSGMQYLFSSRGLNNLGLKTEHQITLYNILTRLVSVIGGCENCFLVIVPIERLEARHYSAPEHS